ncbi:hypothetical protein [Amylibacter sp. IMCC11727]|uniref:hypothetical protein n=1 Tax=Amylibacter sp. IMCC11727 TaxID=3039851 RepID=UPI00244DD0F8|nr:hypothetical protein [Amylibacter sp. IMCC11727]WGI20908.1 hypothetical protein QBD29_12400 [Amylibacter sp. IMCC11727]
MRQLIIFCTLYFFTTPYAIAGGWGLTSKLDSVEQTKEAIVLIFERDRLVPIEHTKFLSQDYDASTCIHYEIFVLGAPDNALIIHQKHLNTLIQNNTKVFLGFIGSFGRTKQISYCQFSTPYSDSTFSELGANTPTFLFGL